MFHQICEDGGPPNLCSEAVIDHICSSLFLLFWLVYGVVVFREGENKEEQNRWLQWLNTHSCWFTMLLLFLFVVLLVWE